MQNLLTIEDLALLFICPRCKTELVCASDGYACANPDCLYAREKQFRVAGAFPVLVDFEKSILDESRVFATEAASLVARRKPTGGNKILTHLFSPPQTATIESVARLIQLAKEMSPNPARTRCWGCHRRPR